MIRLTWHGESLDVQRLVVHPDLAPHFLRTIRGVALHCGLSMVSPAAVTQMGDFWLGCMPDEGWEDADPHDVGWAGWFELEEALETLESSVEETITM